MASVFFGKWYRSYLFFMCIIYKTYPPHRHRYSPVVLGTYVFDIRFRLTHEAKLTFFTQRASLKPVMHC